MDKSTDNSNLFKVIERGDNNINLVQEYAIIMVGRTRSGKSTFFNNMLGKKLLGVEEKKATTSITSYVVAEEGDQHATIAGGFKSVTLAPNVKMTFRQGVSLIDCPGYQDSRDYVGVIGVSYFLKSIFDRAKKIKFLVVMTQSSITDETGDHIKKTFKSFIETFNIQAMNADQIRLLKQSIAVVVTKAKPGVNQYEHLSVSLENMQEQGLEFEHKELIVQILEYLIESQKIETFELALPDQEAPECQIIQNLEKKTWNFIDLAKIENELPAKNKIIQVPYAKQFAALDQKQKNLVTQCFDKKTSSLKQFGTIIEIVMKCYKQSWTKCLEKWRKCQKHTSNCFDMGEMFLTIESFLSQFDDYKTHENPEICEKFSDSKTYLVPSLQKFMEIQRVIQKIGISQNQTSPEQFQQLTENIPKIFKALRFFSTCEKELNLIARVQYVYLEGFKQLSKIWEIDEERIKCLSRIVPDSVNNVQQPQRNLKWNVVNDLQEDILPYAFANLGEFEQYEKFFENFLTQYQDTCEPLFLSQVKSGICYTKGELLSNVNVKQAASYYVETLLKIKETMESIPTSSIAEEQKQIELNKLYLKNCKVIKKLGNILKDMPATGAFEPKIEAIRICKHQKLFNQVCQIYKSIIKDPQTDLAQLKKTLDQYANYTIEWGMLYKAIKLLSRRMALEEEDMNEQMRIASKLREIFDFSNGNIMGPAKNQMSEWKRIPVTEQYGNLLTDIKNKLSQ